MPAPANTTPATAIDIGTLTGATPYSTTQNIYEAPTAYTVWYKYTAVAGDQSLGAFAVGDLDSPINGRYRPLLTVFDSLAHANAGTPAYQPSTVDKCCQFQIDAPTTYYFRIAPFLFFALNPAYGTVLTFSVYRHLEEAIPTGALIINDDGFGADGLPASILDPIDGHVVRFQRGCPQSERLDICHQGRRILVHDVSDDVTKLYDLDFTLLATLPYNINTGALASNRSNRLYIGMLGSPYTGPITPATVYVTDLAGTLVGTISLPGAGYGLYFTIGVNNAGTILYYAGTTDASTGTGPSYRSTIRRWDIVNAVNLSDLASGPTVDAVIDYTLMVLTDDTIVAIWSDSIDGSVVTHLIQYNPDGTVVHNHDLSAVILDDPGPRVCPCEDDLTAVWIWQRGSDEEIPNATSGFKKIQISDGAVLVAFDQVQFNNGVYSAAITETPVDFWGHSESCFFAAWPDTSVPPIEPITGTLALTIPLSASPSLTGHTHPSQRSAACWWRKSAPSTDIPARFGLGPRSAPNNWRSS
jgi:hypothetical protein